MDPRHGIPEISLRFLVLPMLTLLLAACGGGRMTAPVGQQMAVELPTDPSAGRLDDYKIGPLDELSISVFQEPDLSVKEVPVDSSGNIIVPLVGQIRAEGMTARELAADIESRLGERYLVHPQVSLIVTKSVSQRVTVEGQVVKPGVYDIEGRTTLLRAVALAEGPTRVAALDQVGVFHTVGNQRYITRYDLQAIRQGRSPDPEIRGQDIVVVGFSGLKNAYQTALSSLPVLGTIIVTLIR